MLREELSTRWIEQFSSELVPGLTSAFAKINPSRCKNCGSLLLQFPLPVRSERATSNQRAAVAWSGDDAPDGSVSLVRFLGRTTWSGHSGATDRLRSYVCDTSA